MIQKQILCVMLLCLIWTLTGPTNISRADDENINSVGKVVCLGDSITKRGYPKILGEQLKVEAVNAGIAGNTSREGLRRIEKDVFSKDPDVVVIFFGTNDIRIDSPKKYVELDEYKSNLEKMIKACRSHKAKVVLCTLPPIESKPYFTRHDQKMFDDAGGLNQFVTNYRDAAGEVAKETKTPLVDLNQLLTDDPLWLSKDGVHPSKEGNAIIAKHIGSAVGPLLKKNETPLQPVDQ